jgi:hypothetical protein
MLHVIFTLAVAVQRESCRPESQHLGCHPVTGAGAVESNCDRKVLCRSIQLQKDALDQFFHLYLMD